MVATYTVLTADCSLPDSRLVYRMASFLLDVTSNQTSPTMKTIIVTTDFTDSASQALHYAAELAVYLKAEKIVLYNTYSAPPTTTNDMSFSFVETEGLKKMSEEQLAKNKDLLTGLVAGRVTVAVRSDYGFIENQINGLVKELQADLIVTGIEKMGALEEALTGSNAMSILQHVQIPVLMVPPDTVWQPIQNIAWACDYKNLDKTPVWNLKPLLQASGATLHVIHNDAGEKESTDSYAAAQQQIQDWFATIPVTFAFLRDKDLNEAVNQYAAEHQIDLLIAVPKKHGWLEGLFTSSHSKQLAFSAHVAVVCVQEL